MNFNAVTMGHINIGIGNIDNSIEPYIIEASVVEVNGGIYRASRHCQQRLKNRVGDDRIKAGVR
jgi:hypothetical protein